MLAADGFFSQLGIGFGFRWLHILAGITWIGLLYYFNFVQVPAFAEYEQHEGGARARNIAIDKVARKALWWFRWAALSTFVTGILITIVTENYFGDGFGKWSGGIAISVGMLLGTIMMLNVWGVIWRNQKVVLANAVNVLGGGEADPARLRPVAGAHGVAPEHHLLGHDAVLHGLQATARCRPSSCSGSKIGTFWLISLVLIAVLELNASA